MSRRAVVLAALVSGVTALATLTLEAPASAAFSTTNITSPGNGSHYLITDANPSGDPVNVTGTSNGTTGDTVDVRCYYSPYSWNDVSLGVAVQANGTFSTTMSSDDPYGTCVLRAVPPGLPSGSSTSSYTGPKVTSEWRTSQKIGSGPNIGKTYDYYVLFQGSRAMNDYVSATRGGLWDSRLQYSNGYSSAYLWYENGALPGNEGGTRSALQVDGHNAFGPRSALDIYTGSSNAGGYPALTFSASRNATTGVTTIHETNPIVRCPDDTYPPTSVTCPNFVTAGVRLERTITTDDGGRQVHIVDIWRSTNGQQHTISAHYEQYIDGYNPVTDSAAQVGLKLPWLSPYYQTYSGDVLLNGTSSVPNTMFVRDENTAPNGDLNLPRGAITFDTSIAKVHRITKDHFTLRDEGIVVPAGGTIRVRHDYVIGNTEAEIAAKAAASRVQIDPQRPDGLIRKGSNAYVGNNIYNTTGAGQTATAKKKRGTKATFYALIQNDGTFTDTFKLKGTGNKKGFTVSYFAGTKDITSQVEHGTYSLRNLAPGQQRVIKVVIKVKATAKKGALRSWLITSTSTHDTTSKDTVRANVRVKK